MSVNAVKAAAGAAQESKTFPQMLGAYKNHLALALPKHMNADRMARIALTAFRQNPQLENCTPASIFAAVIVGSQLGLEPGVMGQAYLVPYKGECQFIPGWQGYVDLVSRAGRASVWTGAVFQGDEFEYELGDSPFLKHRPCGETDVSKLLYTYAIGRIKDASVPIIEVWPVKKITAHRDRFNKVGGRHYSFQHFEQYGRKVALMQVLKYMPKSVELAQAVDLEHAAEKGSQGLTDPKTVIEGSWTPPAPASDGFDLDAAKASIAAATGVADLNTRWTAILESAKGAGVDVPVELDGAASDRRATLEQKEKAL
jgi:recombination protein RecT